MSSGSSAPHGARNDLVRRTTDRRLVQDCLNGNEEAWAALIDRYRRLIYSIARRYEAGPEDAADIFQSVCVELFSDLPTLRNTESVAAWLVTITHRRCMEWKRMWRRNQADALDAVNEQQTTAAPPALEVLHVFEREQKLHEGIAALPPRCQEMIRLLFFEQPPVPYDQVARRLGLATGSIGFIRSRCLKRLERILKASGA